MFQIDWESRSTALLRCLACGERVLMPFLARLTDSDEGGEHLDYHRCSVCGSIAVLEDRDHSDNSQIVSEESPNSLSPTVKLGQRHMIELGTNFDVQAFALTQVSHPAPARLLDIGCGLGIGLDFARSCHSSAAVGIDPGLLAQRSSQTLDFTLLRGFFPAIDDALSGTFDTIQGWEVIEHIDNPLLFIESARNRLTGDGLLALSTPTAASICPTTPLPILLTCLSPGEHRIIFSPEGLSALFLRAGFQTSRMVVKEGNRFFALAYRDSPEPPDTRPADDLLLSYYRDRAEQLAGDAHFSIAFLMKRIVIFLAWGQWSALERTLAEADRRLQDHWSISLEDRSVIAERLRETADDPYLDRIPLPLPFLLFARGRLAQSRQSAREEIIDYMTLAAAWGEHVVEVLAQAGNSDLILINMVRKARAILAG